MGLSVPAQQREERSVRPLRERHAGWSTVARGEEAREAGTRAELQHVATSQSAQHRTAAAAAAAAAAAPAPAAAVAAIAAAVAAVRGCSMHQ